jgi:hypothetical protein
MSQQVGQLNATLLIDRMREACCVQQQHPTRVPVLQGPVRILHAVKRTYPGAPVQLPPPAGQHLWPVLDLSEVQLGQCVARTCQGLALWLC